MIFASEKLKLKGYLYTAQGVQFTMKSKELHQMWCKVLVHTFVIWTPLRTFSTCKRPFPMVVQFVKIFILQFSLELSWVSWRYMEIQELTPWKTVLKYSFCFGSMVYGKWTLNWVVSRYMPSSIHFVSQ